VNTLVPPLLSRLLDPGTPALSDADLLRAYTSARDERAFRALVERHAPLVYGVCRRALGVGGEADDAFQATFVALARTAGGIRRPEALTAWLYRTALRVTRKARARVARRERTLAHEVAARTADPLAALSARELLDALNAELGRLPARLQLPLILCYWQGLSREEAARRLGCPTGTLHGRLERGRTRLATRLRARGLSPAVLLAPLAIVTAVPDRLAARAAELSRGSVPAAIGNLARAATPSLAPAILVGGATILGVAVLVASLRSQPVPSTPTVAPVVERGPPPAAVDVNGDRLPPGAIVRLGGDRWRHDGEAEGMSFSHDGKTLAVLSKTEGVITLFETSTGKVVHRLPASDRGSFPLVVAFSPDGKVLAAQGRNGAIRLWDVRTRDLLRTLQPPTQGSAGEYRKMDFSPNGKLLAAVGGDNLIILWDVASGKPTVELTGHNHGNPAIAFSPDGAVVAVATIKPIVRLYDARNGKFIRGFDPDQRSAFSLGFSPDGTKIATGGRDRIVISDLATGNELGRCEAKMGGVLDLAFTPDGKTLVSGTEDAKARVWDVVTGKERHVLDSRGWIGRSLALSPDGATVAMGTVYSVIRIWDVATGKEKFNEPSGHDAPVRALAFSPDGRLLMTGGENQQIQVWDAATNRHLRQFTGASIQQLSFSSNGKQFVSVGQWSKEVLIRDVERGKTLHSLAPPGADRVAAATFAPDGTVISVAWQRIVPGRPYGESTLHTWDAATGKILRELRLPVLLPNCLALTPDGRWAAVGGSSEESLWLCDLSRQRTRMPHQGKWIGIVSAAFSTDGRVLATGGYDLQVRLWEVATGREILSMPGHVRSVAAVAFAPGGRVLATADGGPESSYWKGRGPQSVRFWDLATGREFARIEGHASDVSSLAFSQDGRRLVGGLQNGSVLIWETPAAAIAAKPAKKLTDRQLETLWADLGDDDVRRAYEAVWALAAAPDQAVPFLARMLSPAEKLDGAKVRQWLAGLDGDKFAAREAATRQLTQLGDDVEADLRTALASKPSAEAEKRIKQILDDLANAPPPSRLRELRAVWALHLCGTAAARDALAALAKGDPAARLTREAAR
jgi:RNA polymerase sigma factor (sigma-70 family)